MGKRTNARRTSIGSSTGSGGARASRFRLVFLCITLGALLWSCRFGNDTGLDRPNGSGGQAGAGSGTHVDSGGGPPPPAPSDWCSARKVLDDNCSACHFAGTPWATIPLITFEDLNVRLPSGMMAYDSVKQRIHDEARLMPPTADRLTALELATLDNWVNAGAPRGANPSCGTSTDDAGDGAGGTAGAGGASGAGGARPDAGGASGAGGAADGGTDARRDARDAADAGPPDTGADGDGGPKPPTGWPTDCEERYTLLAHGVSRPGDQTKFDVSGSGARDFYQCFLFKAPWSTTTVQGVRFRPVIDDARVVARLVLYGLDSSTATDGQVGISGCRGGTYLQGWAPGGTETVFPADVGLQMPRGANAFLGLEVHYDNAANHANAIDASGVEFCVTKTLRPNTASVHWLGSTNISLARGTQTSVTNTCDPVAPQPAHVVAIQPQMNRLGTRAQLILNRATGARETLHDAPFRITDQATYPSMAVVNDGDTLTTTCTYDNTTTGTVRYGDTMADENCYHFVTAWPAGALSGFLTANRCISPF
jgi:hypothetical protein